MAPNLASVVFAGIAVLPCSSLLRSRSEARKASQVSWRPFTAADLVASPLDFTSAYISHQNLGGAGPDGGDESILFKNIGYVGGSSFDMRFAAATGQTWIGNVSKTELNNDQLIARLNMASGTSTKVNVHLLNSSTGQPVVIPRLFLTILDIDAGSLEDYGTDPNTEGGKEDYTVWPVSEFWVSGVHDLLIEETSSQEYRFTAAEVGGVADNPTDPMALTPQQLNRAVMVEIRNQKYFDFTFAASKGTSSRNVMFSGPSELGLVGTPGSCLTSNHLDLAQAVLKFNNMDKGTNKAAQQLEISNAMMVKGSPVSLIVKVVGGEYEAADHSKTGLFGSFGHINMKQGTDVALSFEFVSVDQKPLYVPNLFFTFADLDQERAEGSSESVTIASDSGTYFLSGNSTVDVTTDGDGFTTFKSTVYGSKDDNPVDALVGSQKDMAVTLHFDHSVQKFTAKFASNTVWDGGRNIMFGGDISLACK